MTQAQATSVRARWKQSGEPLCEHPIQELVRLARSDDGVLMGTYHCRNCGEAIIYVQSSPLFSKGDRATSSFFQIFARRMRLVKSGMRTMLFGRPPGGSVPKQDEEKHNDSRPSSVAERP